VQNICQNVVQNSTVLWQWTPYRCSELLSHQVRANIKHSTITAIVSKIKGGGGYAHFSATLYNTEGLNYASYHDPYTMC
jgi:hypothetical protein